MGKMIGCWKKNNVVRRRISGFMALVLGITTIGAVSFIKSEKVAAKETLDSITQVVGGVTVNNPYTILEIVPDKVSFNGVSINDIRGNVHSVSGNQIMGFTGYYIAGEEPVRQDIALNFNDQDNPKETIDGIIHNYTVSSVSDSNMRYELADAMFSKLYETGILKSNTTGLQLNNNRSVLEAQTFERNGNTHVNAYYEKYISEWTDEEFNELIKNDSIRKLEKNYDGTYDKTLPITEAQEVYVDQAKGQMIPSISGDYIMTYDRAGLKEDDIDVASEFIKGYMSLDEPVDEFAEHSLVYKNRLSIEGEHEGEPEESDKNSFIADFDPKVDYVDDLFIDEMANKQSEVSPNTFAAFGFNEGAEYGYYVRSNKELTVDNSWDGDEWLIKDGTPLYNFNGKYFIYAGRYGSTEELTLSSNTLSKNTTAKADSNKLMAKSETHYLPVALSSGDTALGDISDSDVILQYDNESQESNVLITSDDDKYNSVPQINAEGDDSEIESGSEVNDPLAGDDTGNGDDTENGEETERDPEEPGTENPDPGVILVDTSKYYVLEFGYERNYYPTYSYYSVLEFSKESEDMGAEYYIDYENDDAQLVNAACGYGCIGLADNISNDDLKNFIFDYSKGKGSYLWTRTTYDDPAYPQSNIYRIRGAEIYYGFKLTNNEWFKKYVFDREDKECPQFPISVTTLKASEVEEKDVTSNKMVVLLGGDTRFCLGDNYSDYKKGIIQETTYIDTDGNEQTVREIVGANDLSIPAYKKIVERIAVNKIPIIGDYRIIEHAQTTASGVKGSWVNYLVKALMLKPNVGNDTRSGFGVYYEAIGDKLEGLDLTVETNQFDPANTSGTNISREDEDGNNINNYDHFVNQNAYVYNMKYEAQKDGEYQNFVNLFMYTMDKPNNNSKIKSFSDEERDAGFKEVIEDIRSENRYRMTDNRADKLIPEDVTQATVIRYIIGFANKRERNIKGKLRVLEIEPTNSFDLYIDDTGENYNNFGMAGYSYSTQKGFKTNSRKDLNNDNAILFRNGTYESVTDKDNQKKATGKVYRRSGWKESDIVRKDTHALINLEGIDIELTRMSVAELVGHIEDLNAEYDVIYIGMNTQLLNCVDATANDPGKGVKKGDHIPNYNDTSMNGMIYTSIGDIKRVNAAIASDDNTGRLTQDQANSDVYAERYSGNDLSNEYAVKLTEFVKASYPIILDDGFFKDPEKPKKDREISKYRVDSVSYMYQFADYVKTRDTVYSVSDVTNDTDGFFEWLLNLAKPEIVIKEGSPADTATKVLDPDDQLLSSNPDEFKMYGYELTLDRIDGQFHLPFDFSIRNMGAASSDSEYTVELYVDLNADGKYSTREKIDFTSIQENGTNFGTSGTGLKVGKDYYAQCQLASSFDGVVPWRLVVFQEGHSERRCNVTGYYTLKKDKPVHIKVLQLNQRKDRSGQQFKVNNGKQYEEGQASSWNMASTAYKGGKYRQKNNDAQDELVNYTDRLKADHTFGSLLKSISSYYELEIITEDVDVWETRIATANGATPATLSPNKYYEDLRKYDMLILGFADCYMGPKYEPAMIAIEKYMKSERSTLFTHDCASYHNFNYFEYGNADNSAWHWGYLFNKHVRNFVGMDRFAVMSDAVKVDIYHPYQTIYKPGVGTRTGEPRMDESESAALSGAEEITTPGSKRGNSYFQINYYQKSTGSKNYNNINGINIGKGQDGNSNGELGNIVTQVCDGQITKFPFALHESFPVSATHDQYYQLDLTDDADRDGEKDIVVWYCISDAPVRDFDGQQYAVDNNGKLYKNGGRDGGDLYEMSPNDVRNNYYIYNKGNIVYTGVGHHAVCDSNGDPILKSKGKIKQGRYSSVDEKGLTDNTDEMKLFVNTMIAAYQRGIRSPGLKAVSSYKDNSATGSIYVSYDHDYNNDTGIMDSDIDVYLTANRSNFNNSDSGLVINDLKISMYWEATEEEKNAGKAIEIPPMSTEYDYQGNYNDGAGDKHVYDDGNTTGIYGIPVTIDDVSYWTGSDEVSNPSGSNNLTDGRVYKMTVGGVDTLKTTNDGVEGDNLWYKYNDSDAEDSIQRKSLNNRRIIIVATNDTYNKRTDIGREESTMTYVTLTRAKMFMLE